MKLYFNFSHKLELLLFFSFFSMNIAAQKITYNYKGSWSNWESAPGRIYRYNDLSGCILKTNGLVEFFTFRIPNYKLPSKKEIKQHLKTNTWYEYRGTVEYYVNDAYPTANDIAKSCKLVCPDPRQDVTPQVKRTCSATIKIQPFKKEPTCYNIWFDNIGIGIDIAGLSFGK